MAANEVKTVDGWVLTVETPQGNTYWPEETAKRGLHSKTYKDTLSNTFRFIANTKGAPRHYRADGVNGTGALTDIDLTNPDNIQTFYTLSRLTGTAIGYQYTPRDKTNLTIQVRLEGYTGTGVANERGEVWYSNIGPELDIYSKPLPYRYGIFKVLKGPSAPTTFVFNGSATGDPQTINDAFGGSWTMKDLRSLGSIEDINSITWDANGAEVLMPQRVAWDGNGDPVQVRVTAEYVPSSKSIRLTEQVVLGANPVWPVTVDTDVSYDSSTDDGYVASYSSVYATAQAGSGSKAVYTAARLRVGQYESAGEYMIYRAVVFFVTGELPDDASISAAAIVLDGYADNSSTNFNLTACPYTGNAPPVSGDWGNWGDTDYGNVSTSSYSAGDNTITLNESGRGAIVKTGNSPFGIRSSRDISETAPSAWTDEWTEYESANSTPAPSIDITYSAGTTHDGVAALVTKETLAATATYVHAVATALASKETLTAAGTNVRGGATALTSVNTLLATGTIAPTLTAAMEGACVRLTAYYREVGV